MKKITILWMLLLTSLVSNSQEFTSKTNDFINFNSKELNIDIDNFTYKGHFENFKSKTDSKEYLIYSYFSRSVILELNQDVDTINNKTENLKINSVLVLHSTNLKSIKKAISKKGIQNLSNFIIVNKSENFNKDFIQQNHIK